jgi:hypothetical protein
LNNIQFNQANPNQAPVAAIQHNLSSIRPTAPEIGYLWSSYLAESMSVCMLKYIVAKAKDPDYKPIFQQALDVSSQRLNSMETIFNSLSHPIPVAFGEKDVNTNAKELYSESFLLTYTKLTNEYILQHYCQAYSLATRTDIRDCFSKCIDTARDIHQKASDVLLAKGLLQKPPSIATPEKPDFVNSKNYYGSSIFESKRPLNALEISYIFDDINSKLIIETLNLGFRQVVKDEKIKDYLIRGNKITDKQAGVLGDILEGEDLPVPKTYDYEVTTSEESPFSDRLILTHYTIVLAYTILGYGFALTNSARKDLVTTFTRLISELLTFSKDGTDLLIEHNWLERPPETANRPELVVH